VHDLQRCQEIAGQVLPYDDVEVARHAIGRNTGSRQGGRA
jgi:hypothetical protein